MPTACIYALLAASTWQVIAVAHSSLGFEGQPLEEGQELLVVVIKDSKAKSFFIKIIDTEVSPNRVHPPAGSECINA